MPVSDIRYGVNKLKVKVISAFLLLCGGPAFADTASVLKAIVGKNLTNAQVSESYINADGTLTGVYKGASYSGTWKLKNGKYCREIPAFKASGCQSIVAINNDAGKMIAVEFRNSDSEKGNRYTIE